MAIRFAAPDAASLAGVGDEIDVVGLGGDVIAADVKVLQDRSTAQASVLVVSVPVEDAPAVAAFAAAQDVTLLVAPAAG